MNLIRKYYLLIFILIIALFLRVYKLGLLMQFIPDQGWFYLSARDMLITGRVPLVGPPTSHPWIHHGPLWTYTLALFLYLFSFNPIIPAYFIAFLGIFTVFLMYKVGSQMFSKKVGLISALLFATSPLIVLNSRIPYHTSPIPFFILMLFYLTYLWVRGKTYAFPFICFFLAVLYNHEITTFVFDIAIILLFIYGFIKKKDWLKKTINIKIIFFSVVLSIIPMIPFILYDIGHGYKQTVGFIIWTGYRVVKLPLSFIKPAFISSGSNPSTIPEFLSYYQELTFVKNMKVGILLLVSSIGFGLLLFKKNRSVSMSLLFLFFAVSIVGLFIHRVPIEADTLLMSPFFILLLGIMLERMIIVPKLKIIGVTILVIITVTNTFTLLSRNFFTIPGAYFRLPYYEYERAVKKVVQLTDGKAYNIVGKGELSDFPVFLDPFRYLLWYEGHAPQDKKVDKKIEIWVKETEIIVSEKK